MKKIAIYGKGGIGKSTICSNISAALAQDGIRVMQIGCDPKADSTYALRGGEKLATVLDVFRQKQNNFELSEVVREGYLGVACVEAGGPLPGVGCAGRGIMTALEKLEEKGAYEKYEPKLVIYDVLGDVVCGGFTAPMRSGGADEVYIVTSGENMSIYAVANIAMAMDNFKGRGYAELGGLILNRRDVKNERAKVEELCEDVNSGIVADIPRSELYAEAEEMKKTVVEAFPESEEAKIYRELARRLLESIGESI